MLKPILLVVDDQPNDLETTERELNKRYAADYEIVAAASPVAALERLAALRPVGAQVAILFAAYDMAEMTGEDYLDRAHDLFPYARRVLMIPLGNRSATKPILHAITLGKADRYVTRIARTPDEQFHRLVTELLQEWQRQQQAPTPLVTLIGDRWTPRSYELRDLLDRSGLPFQFHETESQAGRALLERVGLAQGPFPVLVRYDGRALANPRDEEIALALGVRHSNETGVFDLAIVGAGPAGLSAAVYGASEGLRTIMVDRNTFGGQAGSSSLIRNFLGFPFGISGADLAGRALDQAWSFGAETSMMREAVDLRVEGKERILRFADGTQIAGRAVVLAMGAHYQRLGIPSLEALVGAGVYYGGGVTEAQAMAGQQVYVAGGGNSAGQAAVHMAKYAARVTMLVRGSSLAAGMSDYLVQEIAATDNIEVRLRTKIVDGQGRQRLERLVLQDAASEALETVPATALFVLIGAQPHTSWLPKDILCDPRGFILTGPDLSAARAAAGELPPRPPLLLETSVPGVFAVGDVRYGSVKRVAAAVGEGGVAIQSVHQYLALLK